MAEPDEEPGNRTMGPSPAQGGMVPGENIPKAVWQVLILASTAAVLLFSVYCLSHGITIIFMHLYYFPIVLLAYRYRYRGVVLATFLSLAYVGLVYFFDAGQADVIIQAWYRFFVFIGIAVVIAYLSEQLVAGREIVCESEEKYRSFFATSLDCVFITSPDGNWIDFNDVTIALFGYNSRQDLLGVNISDLYANPADRKIHIRYIGEKGYSREYPVDLRKKDGTIINTVITSVAQKDSAGTIIGFQGTIRDITDRKRSEILLNQQFRFLQQLINAIPNPVFYKDANGVYTGCNTEFEKYIGLTKDQIIGKSVYQISPKELADRYFVQDQELLDHPGTQMYESRVKYADGSLHDVVFNKATYADLHGNVQGIVGIILDITERKEAEERLRQNRQLLAAAMDLAHMVSWEYDVATGMFTFDDRFFAFYGTTAEREGGHRISGETYAREFVYPEDIPAVSREIQKVTSITDPTFSTQMEHRIVRRDGTVRTIIVRYAPIFGADGKIVKTYGANQDITELKKAEEVLRESEARYRNLFTNMLEGFAYCRMIYDNAGKPSDFIYLDVNPSFDRIIGTKTVTGKRVTEVFPGIKTAFPELFETYGRVASTGQPASFDLDFSPVGKWLHISAYSPAKDHFVAVFEDITARRLADERLKKAEAKYRHIFETALEGIYQITPEGKFLTANPAMARILGYDSVEDLITTVTDTARFLWVHQEQRKEYLRQLREHDIVQNFEGEFFRKDKSPIWVSLTTHTVRGTDGKILISEGILDDITRRKTAERELIEREAEYRAILRTAMDGFGIVSSDGRFLDVNDALCRLTGYSRDELVSMTVADIEAKETADLIAEHSREILRKGEDRFETQYRRKDGSFIDVEVSVVVTDRHGGQFVTFHHDITERKHVQEALLNSRNELEQKVFDRTRELKTMNESLQAEIALRNKAENEIVASLKEKELLLKEIHHRVKNNMQVISSLLFMQSRAQKDETIKQILKESQDRIKSIALVHEKLYQSTDLERIDYTDYLRKITSHLFESYQVDPNRIVLQLTSERAYLHIDKAVPCSLIVNEMISNSLKHAFPEGRKGVISIDFKKSGDKYILTYSDNGIGIPEGVTFDRAESLGMQLIKGLTKQMNGTIVLKRTARTTYTVTFPA